MRRPLRELSRGYGCSVVFCTATQPALTKEEFERAAPASRPPREMLDGSRLREIVKPDRNLHTRLQRVRAETAGPVSDEALVQALGAASQGLVIVNNRRHARELLDAATAAIDLTVKEEARVARWSKNAASMRTER